MKRISVSGLAVLLLLAAGCVSERVAPVASIRPTLPKLKDYSLYLEIPESRRVVKPAESPALTFMLRNLGRKDVRLVEWQVDEVRNLHYYYRPYDPQILTFDPADPGWKEYLPEQSGPLRYSVLDLSPFNRVFVNLPVPFIDRPGIYMVVGELLLTAVDVRSDITIIEITK
jgi:hypothetical protein